ncbi:MAG: SpoVA/SpoVAEb family sporulation membrane protein [Firmicutes bacterium]|nr:SpoVA/SpoVAEb family sporulation membrane protein [Bacillota bacterium]
MPIILDKILLLIIVFAVGGLLCAIAQLLVVRTKISPARILVVFLIAGIFLETIGVFRYIREFAHAGVTVPIIGFGASLAKGAIEGAKQHGFIGAFSGGLTATALGIGIAVVSSFIVTLAFKPKTK